MAEREEATAPVEATAILPVYTNVIGPAEMIDGVLHLNCSVQQLGADGTPERVLVARLMIPADLLDGLRATIDRARQGAPEPRAAKGPKLSH